MRAVVISVLCFVLAASARAQEGRTDYWSSLDLHVEGKYEEAAAGFLRAADAGYRTSASLYNAACGYAQLRRGPECIGALERALEAGYANYENFFEDFDLDPVRDDPAFAALLARVRAEHPLPTITDDVTSDPDAARFVADDLVHFIEAHARLATDPDTLAVLESLYLARATPGLTLYVQKYGLTAERLRRAIGRHPDSYAAIGEMRARLDEQDAIHREAYRRLQEVVPQTVFPPTYFLVGAHQGIGSGSVEGSLISVEKATTRPDKDWRPLLVHELFHFQQARAVGYADYRKVLAREKTLLGVTIREGAAEFFTDLVTGRYTQEEARAYVEAHEIELARAFREAMLGRETGDWLWTVPDDPDQPPHVAYVLGARIVAAYHQRHGGSTEAVAGILSVRDYPAFFDASGYSETLEVRTSR